MTNELNIFVSKNVQQTPDISRRSITLRSYIAVLLLLFVNPVNAETRLWTVDHQPLKAELIGISVDGTAVALKRSDSGKLMNVLMKQLSTEDKRYVALRFRIEKDDGNLPIKEGDTPCWCWGDKKGNEYIAVAAKIERNEVVLKTFEGKIERIPISNITPECKELLDELRGGKTFGSFDDNTSIAVNIPDIPDDPVVPFEDAAKDGEFGVDVWGDVMEKTARTEYQKQRDAYAKYIKIKENITAKKNEMDASEIRSNGLSDKMRKLSYGAAPYTKLKRQKEDEDDKQSVLRSQISDLEFKYGNYEILHHPPLAPDVSLLQKKEKKIIGTVRAKLIRYADDGMVTYCINEEEKKTHIRDMTSDDMDRIIVERLKRPIDEKFFQPDVIKKQVELFLDGAAPEGFKEEWKKFKWTPQEINRIVLFLLLYQLETKRKYDKAGPCFRGTLHELFKEKAAARSADCPKDVFALMPCVQKALSSEAERVGKMNLAKITELNKEAEILEKANENNPKILILRDQAKTLQSEDAASATYYRKGSEEIDKWKPLFNHWSAHRYSETVRDIKPPTNYDNKNKESELKNLFQ
jgi:hypothetical protein